MVQPPIQCQFCERVIPTRDSEGALRCRACGVVHLLERALWAHGRSLGLREVAAFEAAVRGLIRGVIELASLDMEAAAAEFGAGDGPP
eukprot:9079630-Alexandrium_andersonii.AAC.1